MLFTKTLALAILGFSAMALASPLPDSQDSCDNYAARGNFRNCERWRNEKHDDRERLNREREKLDRDRARLDRDRQNGRGGNTINRDYNRIDRDRDRVRQDRQEVRQDARAQCNTMRPRPDWCNRYN